MIQPLPVVQVILMAAAANTAPLAAGRLSRAPAAALDGGHCLPDGRPLFGPSKTWRGLAGAIIAAALVAPLIGLPLGLGVLAGAAAMLGDVVSSFVKRRLGLAAGAMALGLDQIPEAFFPALVFKPFLLLTWLDIAMVIIIFTVGELVLSQILFRLRLREHPY